MTSCSRNFLKITQPFVFLNVSYLVLFFYIYLDLLVDPVVVLLELVGQLLNLLSKDDVGRRRRCQLVVAQAGQGGQLVVRQTELVGILLIKELISLSFFIIKF